MEDQPTSVGESGMTQSEANICRLFNGQMKMLFSQKWKIADEISEWSKRLIQQIQEYVSEQKKLLGQECDKKLLHLYNLRDQFLEQALIYEQNKDSEQICQLLDHCNALKFELVTLVYIQRPISTIQLRTEEQLIQENQDELDMRDAKCDKFKNLKIKDNNEKEYYRGLLKDSSSKAIFAGAKQSRQVSTTKSTNDDDRPTICRDDLADECPTCFMVFSSNMLLRDRTAHVNGHFQND